MFSPADSLSKRVLVVDGMGSKEPPENRLADYWLLSNLSAIKLSATVNIEGRILSNLKEIFMENRRTRREFIKTMTAGTAALYSTSLLSATERSFGAAKSSINRNSELQLALIGKGNMGTSDTRMALSAGGVKLIAVCDLYDKRLEAATKEWGRDIFLTKDYKEILSMKEVDAVIIATPDHWHQPIAIEAMEAGKHIYCEKPIIHKIEEGTKMLEAGNRSNSLFQIGSQGMASVGNRAAKAIVQKGLIGRVNFVDGQFTSPPGKLFNYNPPADVNPETVWWERFLGNAPKRPFEARRFLAWRSWEDYGTTIAGDLFVHVIASVHYIMDAVGPDKVYTTGGIYHYIDGSRDVPDIMLGYFDYPDRNDLGAFTMSLGANYVDGVSKKWGSIDFRINGSKGSIQVGWDEVKLTTRNDIEPDDADVRDIVGADLERVEKVAPNKFVYKASKEHRGGHLQHVMNFINGVRNGGKLVADLPFGLNASAPALLSYESLKREQAVYWDPESFKIRKKSPK